MVTNQGVAPDQSEQASAFSEVRNWLLRRTYYVHPGLHLRLVLTPAQIFNILHIAAKPSVDRLHLRQLFARGRRYFLRQSDGEDFVIRTVSNVFWLPRGKTYPTATLIAECEALGDDTTLVKLRGKIRLLHVLRSFLWPAFMTSMLIFMPWHPMLIGALIIVLFGLGWMIVRFTAQIEAYEMINFVERVLEDFEYEVPQALPADSPDVVVHGDRQRDFVVAWDKFYNQMQD